MEELVKLKRRMIEKAHERHGECLTGAGGDPLESSFTCELGRMMLWYDTPDKSTHLVMENIG
jgi:hypothetical protein